MDKLEILFHINNKIFDYSNRLLNLVRLLENFKSFSERKRNLQLKGKKSSSKCYVIGLGPSLKSVDLSKLSGDIIVTNRYNKFDYDKKIKPTFYCLMDRAFFVGDSTEDFQQIYSEYSDTTFVVNGLYKDHIKKLINPKDNLYYAYMWNGAFNHTKCLDFTKILPVANNVVNIAIYLALYLEYKEIILLGCDFNSFASPNANHCYKDEKKERQWSLDFELYCYSLVANSHSKLNEYASIRNIKIINATKDSLLDAYISDKNLIKQLYVI